MSRMTKVAADVHRFDAGGINFYVVASSDGLTVVDAGLPGHWKPLAAWLHRNGLSPRDIRAVLLTHHHADHIGFADRAQHSGAALHIHKDDLALLNDSSGPGIPSRFIRNAWRPRVIARVAGWLRTGITKTPSLADVDGCQDGDRLDVPGTPRVVHVPGHTPGSAAYIFEDHGAACTGDALVTEDPATGLRGIGVAPTGLNADDDQALASLDRLADVDVPVLLPGHGAPYHYGVDSALQAARAIGVNW